MLWFWRRPVAAAQIQHLAWEPPCAARAAQEMAKRQKIKKLPKDGDISTIYELALSVSHWPGFLNMG